LVKVEDKLKVKIEVKRSGLEGDHSLNEHQQENLACEQEHNQRRCVLGTTLADPLLMGVPFESKLCFANNVSVFFSPYINIAKSTSFVSSLNLL